jgi:2-polyprenyl-6-methoxyphenol hydroxylase-like FAD-dependent oxidoreductase
MNRILVSGGGIAGLALAWWLERAGQQVVVIDRATAFDPLGHYITLKSQGVAIVREMGLLDACRASEVDLSAVRLQTAAGRPLLERGFDELDSTLGGFVPFRRADLHGALFNAVRSRVEIRYGEQLRMVRQAADRVDVEFLSGTSESFDLLIGADGVHSQTRRLVFGEGFERPLGGLYLALTVNFPHGMEDGLAKVFLGRGQVVILFPTAVDTASALVYYGEGGPMPEGQDSLSIRRFLQDNHADFAPEVRRAFTALDADSFVFTGQVTQVRMPAITRGRIALVGDAAHCPTFLSGMGSSLALQGARQLGRCIAGSPRDLPRALACYEQEIRPVARGYLDSGARMRPFFLDRRRRYALLRDSVLRFTPEWMMRRSMQRFYQAEEVNLMPGNGQG